MRPELEIELQLAVERLGVFVQCRGCNGSDQPGTGSSSETTPEGGGGVPVLMYVRSELVIEI